MRVVTVPRGLRVRYLVREPKVAAWGNGQWVIVGGDWKRVWSRAWHSFHGAKKIVSGRTVLLEVEAERGWE
jgi:hypothetical protein